MPHRIWRTAALAVPAALLTRRLLRARRAISFAGRTVLLSGGSRGLGLEMARHFASEGAQLFLLARSEAELERAAAELSQAGAAVGTAVCDVGDERAVEVAVARAVDRFGGIDVLLHNAGIIQVGPQEHMSRADFEQALAVHAWGGLNLMRACLPYLKERPGARIVNVASIGGLVAIPHLLPYAMSKFALVGLSDGMRAELSTHGIRVTTVCPGLMRTGSHVNAFFKGQHRLEYAWFSISNGLPLFSMDARRAARAIVEACRHGDPRLILTFQARMLHATNALLPGLTAFGQRLAARLLPAPGPGGDARHTGWESRSAAAPSVLTRLSDDATDRNNEHPSLQ